MPRTFLVRRTALQIHTSSTESEEEIEINVSEHSLNQNTEPNGQKVSDTTSGTFSTASDQDTETTPVKSTIHGITKLDKSPTYLSRAVGKAIQVDSVTGTIENKSVLIKEEPIDTELDAEVAFHTDKSFSSYTSEKYPSQRPDSRSSVETFDSQVLYSSTYSDISEGSHQEIERIRGTSLSLPLITPHQPLPPFASLAYNVFVTSRKPMGETLQDSVSVDMEPPVIMRLPLKLPQGSEQGHNQSLNEYKNNVSSQRLQNQDEISPSSESTENDKNSEKLHNDKKPASENTTKSAPKIWNPFHHVSTPKSKVLPNTNTPTAHVNNIPSPLFGHPIVHSVPTFMRTPCIPSGLLTSPQMKLSDITSPNTELPNYNIRQSPYFLDMIESSRSFQTVPQINASQNLTPGFSPRVPSPFLPYQNYYTPDSYMRSHTATSSRTSTPVITPVPLTPSTQTSRPALAHGQRRSSSAVMGTPKRRRIDNLPFQIYRENPSPIVDNSVHNFQYNCPNTPLVNKPGNNQENIPLNLNKTPVSTLQSRVTLQSQSPVILGPTSNSKENIPYADAKEHSVLKVFKNQQTPQKVEVINGGFGIKNPSFVPPKPADITNVQQDHDGKGSFVCKVCGKEFAIQRLLNRHLKCHSETKRYLCTFCGKGFNDTFDLKRHTRIHTGVKPYKCDHCEKSFTQRCSLESHSRKVHNLELNFGYKQRRNKTYVCEDCGHSTIDPEVHFNHLKERHPNCPALAKPHDKRHFKFQTNDRPSSGPLRPRN